jgi:hypothetical protein
MEAAVATVFGLDVACETPPLFLRAARARPTGRTLAMSIDRDRPARADWPEGSDIVCDERVPGGEVNFHIESHPESGFLIWGPAYGAHVLAPDGSRLRCHPEGLPDPAWQRLLISQVLPFAALLHGLEVFHASAVVLDGEVVALLGPSRSGKSSLALALCRRGAGFMADDVLALERREGVLLAHPGSPLASIDPVGPSGGSPEEDPTVLAADERERMVELKGAQEPVRLGSLFFLIRGERKPERPEFQPVTDPRSLLSATFNFVLATPGRLQGLLEVSAMAASLRVETLAFAPPSDSDALALEIERRLRAP